MYDRLFKASVYWIQYNAFVGLSLSNPLAQDATQWYQMQNHWGENFFQTVDIVVIKKFTSQPHGLGLSATLGLLLMH